MSSANASAFPTKTSEPSLAGSQSKGLHVNWVAPSGIFIGFGGTAADIGRAFQTELHYYKVSGAQRISVNSDPMIPAAIASTIKAVRGLYTINEQPTHHVRAVEIASPQLTLSNGSHFITPDDFDTIYDVPSSLTGAGETIGIVAQSRTDFADFTNFRNQTDATFSNPTEVIPTAYGGVDPGPAYTSPPSGGASIGDQGEATLDVLRSGSVAPAASLLLVAASESSGGVGTDAQYLVETTPVPAHVMSISFGECESSAGRRSFFWDTLFQPPRLGGHFGLCAVRRLRRPPAAIPHLRRRLPSLRQQPQFRSAPQADCHLRGRHGV